MRGIMPTFPHHTDLRSQPGPAPGACVVGVRLNKIAPHKYEMDFTEIVNLVGAVMADDQMADTFKTPDGFETLDLDERRDAILKMVAIGQPVPRHLVIDAVGSRASNGWWDMIGPLPDKVRSLSSVNHDCVVACKVENIPADIWAKHRKDYAAPGGHGLKLQNAPSFVGMFKYENGQTGALIFYPVA